MRLRRSFTGLALSLTLLFGLAAPAMAQESSSVSRERLEYLCSKVPLIEARVRAAIAWINGDADTRGSIAWLEVKAAMTTQSHLRETTLRSATGPMVT